MSGICSKHRGHDPTCRLCTVWERLREEGGSALVAKVGAAPEGTTKKGVCSDCGYSDKETIVATGEWVCWRCGDEGEP